GAGDSTLYGITSDAERQRLTRHSDALALSTMALGEIYRNPGVTVDELAATLSVPPQVLDAALQLLSGDGRIALDATSGALRASTFQVPPNAVAGWESAVFDHFQAVSQAIANK